MIKLSLRTDIQIKAETILHTNGRIDLKEYFAKYADKNEYAGNIARICASSIAKLNKLAGNAYIPEELSSILGNDLFNLLQREGLFRYHIFDQKKAKGKAEKTEGMEEVEEIFTINPTSKPIILSEFENNLFENTLFNPCLLTPSISGSGVSNSNTQNIEEIKSTQGIKSKSPTFTPTQESLMQVSSFSLLRQVNDSMLLECPKSYYYLSIEDSALCAVYGILAKKIPYGRLCLEAKKLNIEQERLNMFLIALKYVSALLCDASIFQNGAIPKSLYIENETKSTPENITKHIKENVAQNIKESIRIIPSYEKENVPESTKPSYEKESPLQENPYDFWEFHDLFFHSKSRKDRHATGIIRPFPHRDKNPALLTKTYTQGYNTPSNIDDKKHNKYNKEHLHNDYVHENCVHKEITLTKPSPIHADFFHILQNRRSSRDFRKKNINLDQLTAFLYHSLKVQTYREDILGGISFRPSPSAGALHGLENYVLIATCQGLEKGLYHYNPFSHTLVNLPVPEKVMHTLWKTAQNMAGSAVYPPIYIITTARFKRYQYKYGPIAYSIMLKDQGCQSQTMHLVAESLNLGAVILADPPLEPFATALNLEYFEEGVVGSFALCGRN